MRHGSTQHCQPKFCSQSSSSVYATPHTIAVLLTQLTRGSCQCNVVPSLCSGRLWTVTYDFFLPSCQPGQMTREMGVLHYPETKLLWPEDFYSGLWGDETIRSKVTLASCRWSARCSMACGSRSRKCTQRWELILNSLLLIKYYWEFYPHFTLMFRVTLYAFIFTAESKQGDLYI